MPAEPSAEQQTKAQDMADKYDNGGFAGFKNDEATAAAAPSQKKKQTWDGPGMQTPAKSGFMQQLTGVVNQGKNLMRSDINARMTAWHDATQHPESASMFLKAYPRRDFANVTDVAAANLGSTPRESVEAMSAGRTDLGIPSGAIWNAQRTVTKPGIGEQISVTHAPEESVAEARERIDPRYAVAAYENMEEARRLDAQQDSKTQDKIDALREQFEHPPYVISDIPANRIGVDKPREVEEFADPLGDGSDAIDMTEAVDANGPGFRAYRAAKEGMAKTSGVKPADRGPKRKVVKGEFKESATLLGGYLEGLQDHGYITCDQRAFAKAVFDDDETDAAVEDAAAEEGPDDFEAPGIKHMKDTKKERNEAVQPIVHADDKVTAANELGDVAGYGEIPVNVTKMDVHVDTSSYLEDLMNKGLITPAQYFKARQAFQDGFDTGLKSHLRETTRFDPNERTEDDLP